MIYQTVQTGMCAYVQEWLGTLQNEEWWEYALMHSHRGMVVDIPAVLGDLSAPKRLRLYVDEAVAQGATDLIIWSVV